MIGPALFVIYINDVTSSLQSSVKIFADNTETFKEIYMPKDCEDLQSALYSLQEWSYKWLLNFKTATCKILEFVINCLTLQTNLEITF